MKSILLVEDDESLGETLTARLKKNYQVNWAQSVTEALSLFRSEKKFDLVLLDVGLPDGTGFDLAESIRKTSKVQFVFLTAQSDAESRLRGFEIGAEEFIPKPFHLKELLLRIDHIFQVHEPKLAKLVLKDCVVDFEELSIQRITKGIAEKVEYPAPNEIKLLKFLVDKSPQVVSRDEIMDAIWGVDKYPSQRSIDNIILHLRHLLGEDGESHIRSVRGVGYQWVKNVNEKGGEK